LLVRVSHVKGVTTTAAVRVVPPLKVTARKMPQGTLNGKYPNGESSEAEPQKKIIKRQRAD
jgi:hypothetical protein